MASKQLAREAFRTDTIKVFRFLYWSTRKEGDIDEPYGEVIATDKHTITKAAAGLLKDRHVYRTEVWERTSALERNAVVEMELGNPAHRKLRGARWDDE